MIETCEYRLVQLWPISVGNDSVVLYIFVPSTCTYPDQDTLKIYVVNAPDGPKDLDIFTFSSHICTMNHLHAPIVLDKTTLYTFVISYYMYPAPD